MNQKFQNLETAVRWYRNSQEKFPKLFNFRNANNSVENLRNSGSKVEWKENFQQKVSQNLGIPLHVLLSLEILENAVPLSPGSYRNSTRVFGWMEAPKFSFVVSMHILYIYIYLYLATSCAQLFNNYSSRPNKLWVNSPWGLRGHEGERNNCFSKIQLVGQKYRE